MRTVSGGSGLFWAMKILLDTNVLVAAALTQHPQHAVSIGALARLQGGGGETAICAHALAEAYSTLTATPFSPRVLPAEAEQIVQRQCGGGLAVLPVLPEHYLRAIRMCVQGGWLGGAIYDALHICAAESAGCDIIWTCNVKHLARLAPEWAGRISAPQAP